MHRTSFVVVVLAVVALAATVWYLSPDSASVWTLMAFAAAVVVVPLVVWLPRREFTSIAASWAIGGVIGAYLFGVFVALMAAVLGTVLAAQRWRRPPPQEIVPG
jgi:hypothetical protein